MAQKIVYQADGSPVSILTPCDCRLTLEQIGQKDVPPGIPFWIVDDSMFPTDRTFRDAWELDVASLGASSGIGGTYQENAA